MSLNGFIISKKNYNKDPVQVSMYSSPIDKARKGIAGTVSSSTFGNSLMKKILEKPTRDALKTVKKMVSIQTGSKTLADQCEKNVMKLAVKTYMLVEKQVITLNMLSVPEETSRRIVKTLYVIHLNAFKISDKKQLDDILNSRFSLVISLCVQLAQELKALLSAHLTEKNIKKIDDTFSVVANMDFLSGVYFNESLKEDQNFVMDVARNVLGWEAAQCDNIGLLYDGRSTSFRVSESIKF